MESSIAVFLMRQLACEQLPTSPNPVADAAVPCGIHLVCLPVCKFPSPLCRRSGINMLCLNACCGRSSLGILAEGAIALPVTLSGGALFAN